jgi:hypothetical protein
LKKKTALDYCIITLSALEKAEGELDVTHCGRPVARSVIGNGTA